jgi:hypothetical protein
MHARPTSVRSIQADGRRRAERWRHITSFDAEGRARRRTRGTIPLWICLIGYFPMSWVPYLAQYHLMRRLL